MIFEDWTPEIVRPLLQKMHADRAFSGARRLVFERVLRDRSMRQFYRELLRRDRKTGHYFCPAQNRNSNQSAEEAQLDAICEVLELAVCAATDRISVTTFEEVLQEQELLKFEAERLREMARDMKRPAVLGALALDESSSVAEALQDLETLYRMADRIERFVTVMRRPNDLLVVDKHRGDPTVRGVQILIGAGLERQFGKRLDGTAATLTGAALRAKASPRASRSALTKQKPSKTRTSS